MSLAPLDPELLLNRRRNRFIIGSSYEKAFQASACKAPDDPLPIGLFDPSMHALPQLAMASATSDTELLPALATVRFPVVTTTGSSVMFSVLPAPVCRLLPPAISAQFHVTFHSAAAMSSLKPPALLLLPHYWVFPPDPIARGDSVSRDVTVGVFDVNDSIDASAIRYSACTPVNRLDTLAVGLRLGKPVCDRNMIPLEPEADVSTFFTVANYNTNWLITLHAVARTKETESILLAACNGSTIADFLSRLLPLPSSEPPRLNTRTGPSVLSDPSGPFTIVVQAMRGLLDAAQVANGEGTGASTSIPTDTVPRRSVRSPNKPLSGETQDVTAVSVKSVPPPPPPAAPAPITSSPWHPNLPPRRAAPALPIPLSASKPQLAAAPPSTASSSRSVSSTVQGAGTSLPSFNTPLRPPSPAEEAALIRDQISKEAVLNALADAKYRSSQLDSQAADLEKQQQSLQQLEMQALERLRQRTLLLEEQEAALEQREVELLQKAARQEEESVALAAAAAGAEDRVKQAHEEHGRTVASAQSLAAQILTEARQAAARIQEDAKESAQKVLESARQREAAILLKLKKLEEETEARCNAAWTEVTDRAQALVSGAEAKSADTVAAADVLAASIRKKAEDEAETMLRKARASAKDITSVATAQAQADLDKAVAKARDEAACEAEKQAAKRIADLEAHMALRERIVKEKLTELDSKFYKLRQAKDSGQKEAAALFEQLETAMRDVESKQVEIVQREQRLVGMLPSAAASTRSLPPSVNDAASVVSEATARTSDSGANKASVLKAQLPTWRTSIVKQGEGVVPSPKAKPVTKKPSTPLLSGRASTVGGGSVRISKSPGAGVKVATVTRRGSRVSITSGDSAEESLPPKADPMFCAFCGSLSHFVALDVPSITGHRTVTCPWLDGTLQDSTVSLADITDDAGTAAPTKWIDWIRENAALGVGRDVILAILAENKLRPRAAVATYGPQSDMRQRALLRASAASGRA